MVVGGEARWALDYLMLGLGVVGRVFVFFSLLSLFTAIVGLHEVHDSCGDGLHSRRFDTPTWDLGSGLPSIGAGT